MAWGPGGQAAGGPWCLGLREADGGCTAAPEEPKGRFARGGAAESRLNHPLQGLGVSYPEEAGQGLAAPRAPSATSGIPETHPARILRLRDTAESSRPPRQFVYMATPTRPRVPVPKATVSRTLLLFWVFLQVAGATGTTDVVAAYNLTWKSTNFKTILEWEPKPINHVYTVQISHRLGNWKNKCFYTTDTECDLTDEIVKDVTQTYMARVLSYPASATDSAGESPFTNSPEFTPYEETNLGQPAIQSFRQVGTKLNVIVQDARTLVRKNGTFLSLRDVFGKNLSYALYYWKAASTGKKTAKTNTNEFSIDVDKGENYCFNVQAVISSRRTNQKSTESPTACTSQEKDTFTDVFIIGAVVIVAIIFIIVLSVSLRKCRKARADKSGKENSPLNAA